MHCRSVAMAVLISLFAAGLASARQIRFAKAKTTVSGIPHTESVYHPASKSQVAS